MQGCTRQGRWQMRIWRRKKTCEEICEYLNRYLPEDIEIVRVKQAADRFHSRLNAREKVYQYRVAAGSHKNVFERKYQCPLHENLDVPAMREAAEFLTGTHDFKSFVPIKDEKVFGQNHI